MSHAILQQLRILLEELENGNSQDCQLEVINCVADVLSSPQATQPHVVAAAIEAFELALTKRPDPELQVKVATDLMTMICSADGNIPLQIMETKLRLLLPVCSAINFVPDVALQQNAAFILANLLDHPQIRQLSARILVEGGFSAAPLFEINSLIVQKTQFALSESVAGEKIDAESLFWLINLLRKHTEKSVMFTDFSLVLARLLRISSAAISQPNFQPCWRSILIGAIQLAETIDSLTFEVVDEIIQRLRTPDDLVADAVLRCLKQFCLTLGESFFFGLNCHIATFQLLATVSLPVYLKMNFLHLLKPSFELLLTITNSCNLPDSSMASETILTTVLESIRLMQQDSHLPIVCVSRLIETRVVALPLVYDLVKELMRTLLEESPNSPQLAPASCSLAAAIANSFDWPGLKSTLIINQSSQSILVCFGSCFIDFVKRLVLSVCPILLTLPFESGSWQPFRPLIDSLAICIEKCHSSLISASFIDPHDTPLLFHLLAFKTFSPDHQPINTIIHAMIIDFASKQIDKWKRHAIKLEFHVTDGDLGHPGELASVLEENLPRLNEPMPKSTNNKDLLPIALLIAACSGVGICSALLDRDSFRLFLSQSFRQILQQKNAQSLLLLLHLSLNFLFELSNFDANRLLPIGLEEDVEAFLTSSKNQPPLWYMVQPEFTAWSFRQIVNRRPYLANRLMELVLSSPQQQPLVSVSKWTGFLVEVLITLPHFQIISEFFVSVSFRETFLLENWRIFTSKFFSPESWRDRTDHLDKLKSATLCACFEAISANSSSSQITSRPTVYFLHLVTNCLCESPLIAQKFVEQEDRLLLAAFINRLVNLSQFGNDRDESENELWLGTLNFLNAVFIIYWSSANKQSKNSLPNLRSFALCLASNEVLLKGLVFGVTEQESNVTRKSFYASLVTVTWLWRFVPPGSTIKREHLIETKLFKPVVDHFLEKCSCNQFCCCNLNKIVEETDSNSSSSEDDGDYCIQAMFASLILDSSRPCLSSWICADFAETLLLPRFETAIGGCSSIFKALVQIGSGKTSDRLSKIEDDPWLIINDLIETEQQSSKSEETVAVMPVFVDGVVIGRQ